MIAQLQDRVSHIVIESTLGSALLWVLVLAFLRWCRSAGPSVRAAAFLLPLLLPVALASIFHVFVPVRPAAMPHSDFAEAFIGSQLALPMPLLIVCLLAGMVGIVASLVLLWRQGLAWAWVHRMWEQQQRDDSPLRRRCTAALRSMTASLGVGAPMLVLTAEGDGGSLTTLGSRGYVLVPQTLAAQLDDEELDAFLAHEIAHILRKDNPLGFLATVSRNLMLFNPLAHLALSRFEREQEKAADDCAARLAGNRLALASCLLKGYRFRHWSTRMGVSNLFGHRHGWAIESRVQRLLQAPAKESPSRAAWLALAVLSSVSAIILSVTL